jgi:transketolase
MTGRDLRRRVIEVSLKAGVGHIGSALSICDIVAVLFGGTLRGPGTKDPDRDRFILSKGHAALALYCALEKAGLIMSAELETFCKDGTRLGVHPEHGVPAIDVTTGSLGMGLSIGAGLALSATMKKSKSRTYVLVSDAECNEGSHWEAVMFAAHHRLGSLTAIVDANGFQAMGPTREILSLEPHEERWRAFGWNARVVDGHDEAALRAALQAEPTDDRPRVLIAKTVAGKGVSFMEQQLSWHYYPLNEEQARQALRELGGAP